MKINTQNKLNAKINKRCRWRIQRFFYNANYKFCHDITEMINSSARKIQPSITPDRQSRKYCTTLFDIPPSQSCHDERSNNDEIGKMFDDRVNKGIPSAVKQHSMHWNCHRAHALVASGVLCLDMLCRIPSSAVYVDGRDARNNYLHRIVQLLYKGAAFCTSLCTVLNAYTDRCGNSRIKCTRFKMLLRRMDLLPGSDFPLQNPAVVDDCTAVGSETDQGNVQGERETHVVCK